MGVGDTRGGGYRGYSEWEGWCESRVFRVVGWGCRGYSKGRLSGENERAFT